MLTLSATVVNVFAAPKGTNREGKAYGGQSMVQLQGVNVLRNGQKRVELFTLATQRPDVFEKSLGKEIQVPVGAFASAKGGIQFFLSESTPSSDGPR